MEFKGTRLVVLMVVTFIIIFLMNYLGNPASDRLQRALMTGVSGAVFLAIGFWLFGKFGKDKDDHQNFD